MLKSDHVTQYHNMCAKLAREAPQPHSTPRYPRPGESLENGKCPSCDKNVSRKTVHDVHGCLRTALATKHWVLYEELVGTDIVCPGSDCKGVHATAAKFADHVGVHHADVWDRAGNLCTLPTNGQQCGATFSSRAEAVTNLEAVHGFCGEEGVRQRHSRVCPSLRRRPGVDLRS